MKKIVLAVFLVLLSVSTLTLGGCAIPLGHGGGHGRHMRH